MYTKAALPMDIEFLVQDTFSAVRPQWRVATDLEDASQRFADAVTQNYRAQEADRPAETEESQGESSSDDEADEDEHRLPELEDVQSSGDDVEVRSAQSVSNHQPLSPSVRLLPRQTHNIQCPILRKERLW